MKAERKLGYLAARATHHTVTFKEHVKGRLEWSRQPSILSSWKVQSLWFLVSPEFFLPIQKSYCDFPQNPFTQKGRNEFCFLTTRRAYPKVTVIWFDSLLAFAFLGSLHPPLQQPSAGASGGSATHPHPSCVMAFS